MDAPCRCHADSRPTREELICALARSLEEIDAYRDMLGLVGLNCQRVFSPTDLQSGAVLGLRVEMHNGALSCHPDS